MKTIRKAIGDIGEDLRKEITAFVHEYRGLIFHETQFNEIVSETFHTRLSYLLSYDTNGEFIGICPLHSIKKDSLTCSYSSPAIFEVPFGGWVFNEKRASIHELMKQIQLKWNESLTYWSPLQIERDSYKDSLYDFFPRVSAVIDLSLDEQEIWQKYLNPKKRNKVRKALKLGLKVHAEGIQGMEAFYSLMEDTNYESGHSLKPKEYYKLLMERYYEKNQAVILLVEKDKELLSGVMLTGNKNVIHYWQGASKRNILNYGQGELLQWEAIKWAKANGSRYYDLCVIEKERLPGIAAFKLAFSNHTVPFYHFTKKTLCFRILSKLSRHSSKKSH